MLSQVIRQMRRLDAYSKPVEDFRIRTAFGGTVTLISSVVIGILFFNELMIYLSTEIVEELLVDTTVGDARLKINFDIVFPAMACSFLSVDAMDASGQFQNDVTENVWKEPIHWSENNVGTTMPTVQQSKAENCGSCYGAETSEIQCCNSCDDVIKAYKRKGWALNSMDSVEQCRDREWVQKLHHSLNQGCHIYGWLEVSKVTGNFHIAPGSSVKDVHVHVHNLHQLGPSAFNTSHTIKHFSFGESFPGKKFPLDGETVIANKGGVMVHYFVKIVPTVYVDLKQNRLLTHQFSVTKSKLDIDVNSPDGLPGFFVSYEFSPLMVQLNEKEKPFTHFLTDICVIVGGVFTVASLIDSFLYHSSRKLAEKIRQGKFN